MTNKMKISYIRMRVRLRRSLRRFIDKPDHSHFSQVIDDTPISTFVPTSVTNLYEMYAYCAKNFANKLAFLNPKMTYLIAFEKTKARAAFLQATGYTKGDVIALLGRNSLEWVITYMAITALGAKALVLDFNLTEQFYSPMLETVGAKAIFHDAEFNYAFTGITKYPLSLETCISVPTSFVPENITATDIASLLFTSGTTSNPKIVQLSHQNIYGTAYSVIHMIEPNPDNNFLALLPLYHVYGFVAGFSAPFCAGFGVVFQASFKSSDLLATLNEYAVHYFPCVPQLLETFLEKTLKKIRDESKLKYKLVLFILENAPSLCHIGLKPLIHKLFAPARAVFGKELKFFVSGGARLGRRTFLYLERMGLHVLEGYGLTETTGPVFLNQPKRPKPICVGSPIPGVGAQIRNINREGLGEIWVKGISVMPGYYNNVGVNDIVFDDGWFNTGDLGFLDKDKQLHIRGRKKNVIVLDSGKNVYPEELEGYYKQSEVIGDLAIFGRRINGKEIVYAVITPNTENATCAEIKAELKRMNEGLPTYKAIGQFALAKQPLPKTSTQKVIIREVIKNLDAGLYLTN